MKSNPLLEWDAQIGCLLKHANTWLLMNTEER
jgi:hypothetical protein